MASTSRVQDDLVVWARLALNLRQELFVIGRVVWMQGQDRADGLGGLGIFAGIQLRIGRRFILSNGLGPTALTLIQLAQAPMDGGIATLILQ